MSPSRPTYVCLTNVSIRAWSSSGHFVISIWWRPWYIYRRLYARFVVEPTDYSSTTVEYTGKQSPHVHG